MDATENVGTESGTRKPRADKGVKRKPRTEAFVLQVRDDKATVQYKAWLDVDTAATELKAWKIREERMVAGTCRVVRQHGRERTGELQPRLVEV